MLYEGVMGYAQNRETLHVLAAAISKTSQRPIGHTYGDVANVNRAAAPESTDYQTIH